MRERNIDWLPFTCTQTGGQTHNPGTHPDQESNPQTFSLQDDTQPAEPHQPGPPLSFYNLNVILEIKNIYWATSLSFYPFLLPDITYFNKFYIIQYKYQVLFIVCFSSLESLLGSYIFLRAVLKCLPETNVEEHTGFGPQQ